MMSRFKSILFGIALAFGVSSSPLLAQASSGNIDGLASTGETIIIDNAKTGFHREINIERDGKFSLRRVPIGSYTVLRVAADGKTATQQLVIVQVGTTARVK